MPRKAIPRAFKLVCKHYRGFDRHITFKALATRKFHATQGVIVNQKLAAAPDCKYSKNHSIVRSYALNYPSFAAQPAVNRAASQLPHHFHSHAASSQPSPSAPSFAAHPVWQPQPSEPLPSAVPAANDTVISESATSTQSTPLKLVSDPVYQYATLNQPAEQESVTSSKAIKSKERAALKWYGRLDHKPIAKVSASPSRRAAQPDQSRLAAAFAAYADLDGPKH